MPTPVSTARQCLTQEAAQSLDEAAIVARRRGHAQTTSLHLVSALLSPTSSALREACSRARNNAYSSRVQFKALELCLGVSLDRLPSSLSQRVHEPPVSNSLMAAIKRSQANQRRQPENFQFYQQQSSISVVKVELQNLLLSILDDPVVSRVFGEAGFRSCDIKLAIIRPVFKYSRYKGPPMFLCHLPGGNSDIGFRSFSFPFLGFSGGDDDNSRRIGDILVKTRGRNPLLVGVCASYALRNFIQMLQKRKGGGLLPVELCGLGVVCVENEVVKSVNDDYNEGLLRLRFEEIGRILEHCGGPGLVVNFGDLKVLASDDASVDAVGYVVGELARLLQCYSGKVWLIGATAKYETYLKFFNRFPSIEKIWDLQLLPITSLRPSMGEPHTKSSLMESFVPFGGLFPFPNDMKRPFCSSSYRCHVCDEKCEQEVTSLSKGVLTASVADLYQSSLPSWLQMAESNVNSSLDKAKDEGMVLSTKIAGLQRKWDNICQRFHQTETSPVVDTHRVGPKVPAIVGFKVSEDTNENVNCLSLGSGSNNSCTKMYLEQIPTSNASSSLAVVSKSTNVNFLPELCEKPSENDEVGCPKSPHSFSSCSVGDRNTSPTSANSMTADLGLGIHSTFTSRESEKPNNNTNTRVQQEFSSCFSVDVNGVPGTTSNYPAQFSSLSCSRFCGPLDQKDYKMLYNDLYKRVGRQEEAISVISQIIVRCRTINEKRLGATRGDIWFSFLGHDKLGKKKVALALAEVIYGSSSSFICVDLSFQDGTICNHMSIDGQESRTNDLKFRGKNVVDYIADELVKNPLSVVFLENADKADLLAQNSLLQAMRTGRFLDSRGREVGISNAIFVTTSSSREGVAALTSAKASNNYSEESISKVKGWQIQMQVGFDLGDDFLVHNLRVLDTTRESNTNPIFMNKRKLLGSNGTIEQNDTLEMTKRAHKASNASLDLNLPAEESDLFDTDSGILDSEPNSGASKAWLEDFFAEVDERVVFKSFDFDDLAESILNVINGCFRKIVGSECSLEVDIKVMEQILAAACSSDTNRVEQWIQQVLSRGLTEAQERYNLSARSVLKLVICEGHVPEEQVPGVFLPARIMLS